MINSLTLRTLIIAAVPIIYSVPTCATTITLISNSSLTNNGSGTTDDITPDSVWAAPLIAPSGTASHWVSDVSTTTENSPFGSTITFTDTFNLIGNAALYFGSVSVMADDSTSVVLNGHVLYAVDPNQGTYCASAPIGCLTSTELTLSLPSIDFVTGANQLSFGVRQGVADTPYGLDFAGSVSNAPEPAGIGLLGCGLMAISLIVRRARTVRQQN